MTIHLDLFWVVYILSVIWLPVIAVSGYKAARKDMPLGAIVVVLITMFIPALNSILSLLGSILAIGMFLEREEVEEFFSTKVLKFDDRRRY